MSEQPYDPSDREQREPFLEKQETYNRELRYLAPYHRYDRGGESASIGLFASCVFVGYLDHEPLTYHWQPLAILWHPAVVVGVFAVCFAAYLWCRSWYDNNPPGPDLPPGPGVRFGFWAPLGLALAGLVLLGSLAGLTACAAGVAVAAWLYAHRRTGGALWLYAGPDAGGAPRRRIVRRIARVAVLLVPWSLVPSSVIPPLIGFPAPNVSAVFVLGVLGGALFLIGPVVAGHYYRYVLRMRRGEGSAS